MRRYWQIFFGLLILECALALVWLGSVSVDNNSSIQGGYSLYRLAAIGLLILFLAASLTLFLLIWKKPSWADGWLRLAQKFVMSRRVLLIGATICAALLTMFLFPRLFGAIRLSALFEKARPVLLLLLLLGFETMLMIVILQRRYDQGSAARQSHKIIIFFFTVLVISLSLFLLFSEEGKQSTHTINVNVQTWRYIQSFDAPRLEMQAADYCSPKYQTDLDQLHKLAEDAAARFADVDRRQALKAIFNRLTEGAKTNTEKHLKVLKFIHRASIHTKIPAQDAHGNSITDPWW